MISTQVFAGNQITRKDLKFNSSNDCTERLDILEKENQHLLGRVEIIEHTIAKLERILGSTKQEDTRLYKISSEDTSTAKNLADDSIVGDVFEIPATKEVQKEVASHNIAEPISGIAKDKQLYDLALASLKDNKLTDAEEKFVIF